MQSKWVRREVRAADRADIPILPVFIGGAPVPDELALILNDLHQMRLGTFDERTSGFLRLMIAMPIFFASMLFIGAGTALRGSGLRKRI